MYKKLLIIKTIILSYLFSLNMFVFAAPPKVNCFWLPGCVDNTVENPSAVWENSNIGIELINSLVWQIIQFVAVIAVISLILSGIMYLLSWWEEEKTKKAKSWIIWSLTWVILSISAWWIIKILNTFTIS